MSNNEWQVLNVVKTLDEVTAIVQQHQVSKFRKSALSIDHANIPLPSSQLSNIISYNRRKNNPEIFSVYDLRKWCNDHKDGGDSSHSTFVPYYSIDNVDNIFVLFTTNPIYNFVTMFGASDADRHFRPFGIALVSSDESSTCYEQLFNGKKPFRQKTISQKTIRHGEMSRAGSPIGEVSIPFHPEFVQFHQLAKWHMIFC
ncbi:unnamed protein product, partial [Didymodactylos carnosus]